ncbi:substrate-binding domain-containing protein [Litoribrevibacter albus]|nr:substrate-binding domain-containing protein [Litoribrevibacter albus]
MYQFKELAITKYLSLLFISCFNAVMISLPTVQCHAETLRLATTTTLHNSGLLDYLLPKIENDIQTKIDHKVTATGQALRLGKLGEVDVLLVHAPAAERKFVREGWGIGRYPVMKNNFLLVGPQDDPVQIKGAKNLSSVFLKFTSGKATFVSRGDQSGTHKKEVYLWNKHALFPVGASWYYEAGQNMKKTLAYASKVGAYTLVDKGTWLAHKASSTLAELYTDDPDLINVYSVILINSERHHINIKESSDFLDWFLSDRGRQVISEFKIENQMPFESISSR